MKAPYVPLLITLVFNLWVWRLFWENLLVGCVVFVNTLMLNFLFLKGTPLRNLVWFLVGFLILVVLQVTTTVGASLTKLSADEQRIIDLRVREYPIYKLPIGYWLEARPESIVVLRIQKNIFENLDPNLYFFANHPRQRVGVKEFEKFPYIFLPFFLYGLYSLMRVPQNRGVFLVFFVPLLVAGFIGNKNALGLFPLFPLLAVSTARGLEPLTKHKRLFMGFLILLLLVFTQAYSYEKTP